MHKAIETDEKAGIYLRLMTQDDTQRIVNWRNNPQVRDWFIYREPFTQEGHENWIHTMIETGKVVQMMICAMENDKPLGSVYVRDIDRHSGKAEYGIFIGEEEARGKGYGTSAAVMMLRYCFEELKLHKVFLRVLAKNERAISSYKKAGFVQEAYLKDEVFLENKYEDVVLMAVIRTKEGEQ